MNKDFKKNNHLKSYSSSSKKIATLSFLTALQVPSCVNSKGQRFIPPNQTWDSASLIPDNVTALQQKTIDTLSKICPDLNGQNALRNAIKKGDLKEVNDLLKGSSVDPNKVGNQLTSLVLALTCKHKKIFYTLLADERIDTTTPDPKTGSTPLHLAVINKWKHAAAWLVKNLPVEALYAQDKNGTRPLHYAIASNDINIVELLINRVLPAKEELVRILMSTLKYKDTISFRYKYEKIIHFLLKTLLSKYTTSSLDHLYLPDDLGMTLLHLLIKRGDIHGVNDLANKLCLDGLLARDNKQRTPLHMAARYKSRKIFDILLKRINNLDPARAVDALFKTDYNGYPVIESSYLPKHKDFTALLHNSHIQFPVLSSQGSEMFKFILLKLLPTLNIHLDVNQLIIISRAIEDKLDGMTMYKGYAAKLRSIVSAYIMQEYGANAKQILKKVSHAKNLLKWQRNQDSALAG